MRETLQSQKLQNADVNNLPSSDISLSPCFCISRSVCVSFLLPSSSPSLSLFTLSHARLSGHICVRQRANKNNRQKHCLSKIEFLGNMTNLLPNSSELPEKENRYLLQENIQQSFCTSIKPLKKKHQLVFRTC